MGNGLCSSSGQSKGTKRSPPQGGSAGKGAVGNSPLDRPQKGEPGAKEGTPEVGSKSPSSQGTPDSPKAESQDEPKNQLGGLPPRRATEHTLTPNAADRWGDLPLQAREVFRNQGKSDLPPEYVDWIDAYYRRLNQLK